MWFVKDWCGIVVLIITYSSTILIVTTVFQFQILCFESIFNLKMLFFSIFVVLSISSHVKCVITDPGALPKHFKPNLKKVSPIFVQYININSKLTRQLPNEKEEKELKESKEKNEKDNNNINNNQEHFKKYVNRICFICNGFKPPRVHHCSICQRNYKIDVF